MIEEQLDWVENDYIDQARIDLLALKQKVEDLKQTIQRSKDKLAQESLKLIDLCPHNPADLLSNSSYHAGGYLDTGWTTYWQDCQICGTKLNYREDSDGYYG